MAKGKNFKTICIELIKILICLLLIFATVYPMWHVVAYSISDSQQAMGGGLFLLPRGLSVDAWRVVFKMKDVFRAFGVSIAKTLVGTAISVVLSILLAYPLSLRYFKGRTFLQSAIFFTMLFSGGTIPTYILIKELGLLDTFWVYVLPGAISAYNMFILRTYFQSLPASLAEAAMLDGAGHGRTLLYVVLPLSKSAIATQVMFYAVGNWNSYMDGVLYVNDSKLMLLQVYLRKLIVSTGAKAAAASSAGFSGGLNNVTDESLKMAVVSLTVIPVVLLYMCMQKYFVKGMMVGSIKG